MNSDSRLLSSRFPRANRYHPDWVLAHASGGANSLWLAEWLGSGMDLKPGMRVLDLGCGKACSSIFLHREWGVQVWAMDLWFAASENAQRIQEAGVADHVFPIHADARSLPFAGEFFDAIVGIDSFMYFASDDLFLNYLAHFLKPSGQLGIALAGLTQEITGPVPEHLRKWWTSDLWSLHSPAWYRRHWEKTGFVQIEVADNMPEGWRVWLDWHHTFCPNNHDEIQAVSADAGQYLGYTRVIARRKEGVSFSDYCWPDPLRSVPIQFTPGKPLLREGV